MNNHQLKSNAPAQRAGKRKGKSAAALRNELEKLKAILLERNGQLAANQQELENKQQEINALQKKIPAMETELKQAEEIKQENIELKKQLHALVEKSSRQTEELKRELRESERQRLHLEQENKDLRTQLAEYVQKYRAAQIELANRSATNLPLPDDSQKTVIPKNAEATVANAGVKREAMIPLNSVKILKQIKIQQSDQFISPGQPLRALRPFTVLTTMRLQKAPSASALANELADFAVTVEAQGTKANELNKASAVEELVCGKQDYHITVPMPSLKAGEYCLKISALVPYARIDEQEKLEIAVVN